MNINLPAAILFDLDDTLVDFTSGARPAWKQVCAQAGERESGLNPEALYKEIIKTRQWFWSDSNSDRARSGRMDLHDVSRRIVGESLTRLGIDQPTLADWMGATYRRLRDEYLKLFPGVLEALSRIRGEGILLGLLTNGSSVGQQSKIDRFALAGFFDVVLIEGDFGSGKPEEPVFRHALDSLGVDASEAWMVGDDLTIDIAPSKRLGIFGVWVDSGGTGLPDPSPVTPDRVVKSVSELP